MKVRRSGCRERPNSDSGIGEEMSGVITSDRDGGCSSGLIFGDRNLDVILVGSYNSAESVALTGSSVGASASVGYPRHLSNRSPHRLRLRLIHAGPGRFPFALPSNSGGSILFVEPHRWSASVPPN